MNTCINIKIKTKAIILDHLQAALSLPSRYHYKAPQSGSDKLLWGNIRSILSLWKNQSNKLVLFSFLLQNYCSAGSVSSSDSSCNPVTFGHNTRKTVPECGKGWRKTECLFTPLSEFWGFGLKSLHNRFQLEWNDPSKLKQEHLLTCHSLC